MKSLSLGIALMIFAIAVVGCNKASSTTKKPEEKERKTETGKQGERTPAEHKTMKPVTTPASKDKKTMPEGKKPESKPETKKPEAKPAAGKESNPAPK